MLISEKTNELIPRKLTDRRMDGRTDGQSLFYSTLPAEAGAPKKHFSLEHVSIYKYHPFILKLTLL